MVISVLYPGQETEPRAEFQEKLAELHSSTSVIFEVEFRAHFVGRKTTGSLRLWKECWIITQRSPKDGKKRRRNWRVCKGGGGAVRRQNSSSLPVGMQTGTTTMETSGNFSENKSCDHMTQRCHSWACTRGLHSTTETLTHPWLLPLYCKEQGNPIIPDVRKQMSGW